MIGICVFCQGDKGQPHPPIENLPEVRRGEMAAAAGLLGAALMAGGLLLAVAVAIPATREPLLARSRLAPPLLELSRTLALMAPGLPLPDGEPAGGGDSGRAG